MTTTRRLPRRTLAPKTTTTRYRPTALASALFLCSGCDQWAALTSYVPTSDGPRCPMCAAHEQ
ncbi:MAG: hypothetical protein HY690_05205 [Chloroflexi bacterium]|nr:hypothetical protein [Chloroflexota bacterium]